MYALIDPVPPNIQMPSGSRCALPFSTNGSDVHTLSLVRAPLKGVLVLSPSLPMYANCTSSPSLVRPSTSVEPSQ